MEALNAAVTEAVVGLEVWSWMELLKTDVVVVVTPAMVVVTEFNMMNKWMMKFMILFAPEASLSLVLLSIRQS